LKTPFRDPRIIQPQATKERHSSRVAPTKRDINTTYNTYSGIQSFRPLESSTAEDQINSDYRDIQQDPTPELRRQIMPAAANDIRGPARDPKTPIERNPLNDFLYSYIQNTLNRFQSKEDDPTALLNTGIRS
jgi:hypothetical protein